MKFLALVVLACVLLLALTAGCSRWGNSTMMYHGEIRAQVRAEGRETSCHIPTAHFSHAGLLNSSASGWIVGPGGPYDNPRTRPLGNGEGAQFCHLYLEMKSEPAAGAVFHVGHGGVEATRVDAASLRIPEPYSGTAESGTVHIEEASRARIQGRFSLVFPRRLTSDDGPPAEIEGTFEVRRDP